MAHDIFSRLREDHDRARTLLDILERTSGDSRGRRELLPKLMQEVSAHAHAEELVVYGELLRLPQSREMAARSVEEHQKIELMFEELDEISNSSPGWLRRFATLAEALRHHMDEEERELFSLAGRVLADERKRAMVEAFDSAKRSELDRVA